MPVRRSPGAAMIGITALRAEGTGCPWAGGAVRTFAREDVCAIGKINYYNDSVTRFLVRLASGAELFVRGTDQSEEDCKWLYKAGKGLSAGLPTRAGWSLAWRTL